MLKSTSTRAHSKSKSSLGLREALLVVGAAWLGAAVARRVRISNAPQFSGKTVVIFGGSRGLGFVLARRFAAEGAKLALLARDAEELQRAVFDIRGRGADAEGFVCDVTDAIAVSEAIGKVAARFGGLDVLVNDAGLMRVGPFADSPDADFRAAMDVHLWGPLRTIRAALPWLRRSRMPRIVNIASIGGKIGVPRMAAYSASKHALVGLSDGLRAEFARDRIPITVVCPGPMRTGSIDQAEFRGDREAEYGWFAAGASLPGASLSAEAAADAILDACRIGQAELIMPWSARAMARTRANFPELFATMLGWVDRALPRPTMSGGSAVKGRDVKHGPLVKAATTLSRIAAVHNNEGLAH